MQHNGDTTAAPVSCARSSGASHPGSTATSLSTNATNSGVDVTEREVASLVRLQEVVGPDKGEIVDPSLRLEILRDLTR